MDKSILKAFKSLPYILYRKKYLIPQAPFPQTRVVEEQPGRKRDYFNIIKKHYPYLINQQLVKISQENKADQLKTILYSQYSKKKLEYEQQIKAYINQYIKPLQIVGKHTHPHFFYFYDNKDQIEKIMSQTGQKRFTVMYKMYKQLDAQTKKIYQQKCEQRIKQLMKDQLQAQAKFKIPDRLFTHPHILYLREKMTQPISIHSYKLYKAIPQHQKEFYREKARQLKAQDKRNLEAFLAERNLTVQQFTYIKKICQQVVQIKKTIKQQKSTKLAISRIISKKTNQTPNLTIQQGKGKGITKQTSQLTKQQENQLNEWKKQMQFQKDTWIDQNIYVSEDQTLLEESNLSQTLNKLKNDRKQ